MIVVNLQRYGKFCFLFLLSVVIALSTLNIRVDAYTGLGAGTIGDPYRVTNCVQLQEMNDDLDAHYILTNDIDCSDTVNWNGGEGFIPIGLSPFFSGTFNGQNFTVSSLYISQTDGSNVGLFGTIDNAVVQNIHLRGGTVSNTSSSPYAGTLASDSYNSTISNCSSTTALNSVDGGGIVGYINEGSLDSCWYAGTTTLTGSRYTGGIFGLSTDTTISNLYTNGTINARGGIAGVVGTGTTISNVYSDANVTFNGNVFEAGGLFGSIDGVSDPTTASNIFFAGSITATLAPDVGGAIGSRENGATVSGVYYDAFLCNCSVGIGAMSGGSGSASGVNAANATPNYFKGNSTNPPLDNWDFSSVWQVNTGDYPTLQNQPREDSSVEDLNGDGIIDSAQPNLSGYTSILTDKTVVIDVGEDCEITTDDIDSESSLEAPDPAYEYENGLFDFAADCPAPGYTTTIRLYYYGVSKADLVVRKYDPNTQTFFNLTGAYGATLTETTIGGNKVTVASYQITDGGDLDMDGEVNSQITDPVGLASLVIEVPNTGLGGPK